MLNHTKIDNVIHIPRCNTTNINFLEYSLARSVGRTHAGLPLRGGEASAAAGGRFLFIDHVAVGYRNCAGQLDNSFFSRPPPARVDKALTQQVRVLTTSRDRRGRVTFKRQNLSGGPARWNYPCTWRRRLATRSAPCRSLQPAQPGTVQADCVCIVYPGVCYRGRRRCKLDPGLKDPPVFRGSVCK